MAKAFKDLKASGKVRHFGASNYSPSQLQLLQAALEKQKLSLTTVCACLWYANTSMTQETSAAVRTPSLSRLTRLSTKHTRTHRPSWSRPS